MSIPSFNTSFLEELDANWGLTTAAERSQEQRAWKRMHQTYEYETLSANPENTLDIYAQVLGQNNVATISPDTDTADMNRLEGVRTDLLTTLENLVAQNPGKLTDWELAAFLDYDIEDLMMLGADSVLPIERLADLQYRAASVTEMRIDQQSELDRRIEERLRSARGQKVFNPAQWVLGGFGPQDSKDLTAGEVVQIRKDETERWMNEQRGRADLNYETEIAEWKDRQRDDIRNAMSANAAYEELFGARLGSNQSIWNGLGVMMPVKNYTWNDLDLLVYPEIGFDESRDEELTAKYAELRDKSVEWTDEMEEELDRQTADMVDYIRQYPLEADRALRERSISDAVLGGLGAGISGIATGLGWAAWLWDRTMPGQDFHGPLSFLTPWDTIQRWGANNQERARAEAEAERNTPDQELVDRYARQTVTQAWEDMRATDFKAFEEYVAAADGNEVLAQAIFWGDVQDNEQWQQAAKQMLDAEKADQEWRIQALQETDFSFSNEVMNVAMSYGKWLPDRIATSVMIGITDKDLWDTVSAEGWRSGWEYIEERGNDLGWQPSAVVGLDGSAIGLTMDMGLGVVFDPLTVLAGPQFRGAAKGALLGTVDNALRISGSPAVRLLGREIAHIATSPQRSAAALYLASSWLSGQARSRILAITGVTQDILPKLDPGTGWKATRGAHEVNTQFLNKLLPEKFTDGMYGPGYIEDLADDISLNNFEKPIEVEVMRGADGGATVRLADGGARLRAAEQLGLDRIPVVVKITDDPGLALAADADRLLEIAEGRHVVSPNRTPGADDTTRRQMIEWGEIFEGKQPVPDWMRTEEFDTFAPIDEFSQDIVNQLELADDLPESTVQAMRTELRARRSVDNLGRPTVEDMGKFKSKSGRNHTVKRVKQIDEKGQESVFYYTVDQKNGEISAGLWSSEKFGNAMGTGHYSEGQGVMEQLIRTAHRNGDYLLLRSGTSPGMSENAMGFSQALAQKFYKETQKPIFALDNILGDYDAKASLASLSDNTGNVQTRPESFFPDEVLGLKVDDEIFKIIQEDIMNGTRPTDGARALLNTSLRQRVLSAIDRMPDAISVPANEIRQFFTQANVTSHVDLHSPEAITDIIQQGMKVWGSDWERASYWTAKLLDYEMEAARKTRGWSQRQALLKPLIDKVEALREQSPHLWDETFSDLATASEQAKAGLVRFEGRNFKDFDDFLEYMIDNQQTFGDVLDEGTGVKATWERLLEESRQRSGKIPEEEQLKQAMLNRAQLNVARKNAIKELDSMSRAIQKQVGAIPDQSNLAEIVVEMYEDFNRRHIVPRWKKQIEARPEILDAEKGILKWEELQKESLWARRRKASGQDHTTEGFFSETMREQARKVGIEDPSKLEKLYRQINGLPDTKMSLNLPLSPIDMIAASSATGSKWIRFQQRMGVELVKDLYEGTLKVWMIDKVLRPATAATVSADELLRIFHKGGHWAVRRYINDRLLFAEARMQNRLHGGRYWGRDSVRRGSEWAPRTQARLRQLDEYTVSAREWERVWYDDFGIGWSDIHPDDVGYRDAAKQWSANMMQQSGFRAFLRGRDDFRDWFFSRDGDVIRRGTILNTDGTTAILHDWEKAFDGWDFIFNEVVMAEAKAAGTYDDVVRLWRETASQIDARGGKAIDMPEEVYSNLGSIRGVQKHTRHRANPLRATDGFFDRFFLDPVQYRRGFVADMVAQKERSRLITLFQSQNKRVMPDIEAEQALNLQGLQGVSGTGARHLIHKEALRHGIIPESYLDELVQRHVNAEIDHMLYVAERGSRAGNSLRNIFPFGKPYADMMAFWGREMLRRPHYRSQFIEKNMIDKFADFGDNFGALRATSALSNINPRTPALISRLAGTDMTIDRGWDGGLVSGLEDDERVGLLPGTESTDLSPYLFLPTEGENVFYSVLPGIGYIPTFLMDRAMVALAGDPIEDPLRYREVVDQFAEFIPGAHFGSPDMGLSAMQRVLGGGTLSQMFAGALDVDSMIGGGGHPYWNTVLGQPDREIDRSRIASAKLADPDEWAELDTLTTAEDINTWIDSIALDADRLAGLGNLIEQGSRFLMPTDNKYSGDLDTIWDIWVDAGLNDTRLLGYNTDYDDKTASPEERLSFARKVRSRFFDLPQASRDAMVASNPSLAANLVSSWEWTDEAHSAGVTDGVAYRTGGSRSDLARHWLYIREGYIRPLAPEERIRRVVGLVMNARESTAKGVYTSVARNWNDYQWEYIVSPQDKQLVEQLYSQFEEDWNLVGIEAPVELWRSWGTYEEDLELMYAEQLGIEPVRGVSRKKKDITPFDRLRTEVVKLSTKPWSETWPGIDLEGGPSEQMSNVPLSVFGDRLYDDIIREQADAVGINLDQAATGLDLWSFAQQKVVEIPRTVQLSVDPAYQSYIGSRSVVGRAVADNLRSAMEDQRFSADWRKQLEQFVDFENSISERYREAPLGIPPNRMIEVQNRFLEVMQGVDDSTLIDFKQLWELGFEKQYGQLGWVPPEPRIPVDENGPVDGAYAPYILDLVDGDSMVVRKSPRGETHEVRLLGVRARDYGIDDEGAIEDKDRLYDAILQAEANGDRIWLVREPDRFGNVDMFNRELAWLWIGDQPFWFPEEMIPTRNEPGSSYQDPFGGDE